MSMEAEAGTFMGIECAVTGPDGKLELLQLNLFEGTIHSGHGNRYRQVADDC